MFNLRSKLEGLFSINVGGESMKVRQNFDDNGNLGTSIYDFLMSAGMSVV